MEPYEERMQKLIEQDIPPFLALCSEKDRQFLLKRDSDRTTEEYVRLLYIGLAFKMRGVFFRILGYIFLRVVSGYGSANCVCNRHGFNTVFAACNDI